MLAFQNHLITRQQLIDAFTSWTGSPSQAFCEILVNQGSLRPDERERLEQLVQAYQMNNDEKAESIALFSSYSSLCDELSQIASQPNSKVMGVDFFSKTAGFEGSFSTTNGEPKLGGMDRFRIVKELARGGLGVVFVAEDKQLRREVALKQIRADRADVGAFRQKFNFEAEVTGQLEHPGIVPIYALGSDNRGRPFYAMRFIQGESLKEGIKTYHENSAKLSKHFDSPELRQLLRRFIDICNAIDYAHDQGILHRDLKPGNIMLGRHGETLVVDWGLAKAFRDTGNSPNANLSNSEDPGLSSGKGSGEATRDGGFVGTATYAPPEQLRGEHSKLCPASDVYSLGGIMYEILTGRPPIEQSSSIAEVLQQIETRQRIGIRSIRPGTPPRLAFVCDKALRSELSDRFSKVSELRDAVQCWLDDQAVPGMPESIVEKGARWIRNHKTLTTSGLVSLVSAAILFAALYISAQRSLATEIRLRKDAEEAKAEVSTLLDQAKQANCELLLTGAQVARSRGQFREAAANMLKVQEQNGLTNEQKMLFAGDLAKAEKQRLAMKAVQEIDPSRLSPSSVANLDLLVGDLQLNTTEAKKGFDRINSAIASQLLNPADKAYAKSLIADSASDCQMHLRECLRLDPLNINAISNLGFTCAVMGEINEAQAQVAYGLTLYPKDIRLTVLSAFITAVGHETPQLPLALSKLEAIGGLESEIKAIKIAAKIFEMFELIALHGKVPSGFELVNLIAELATLRNLQVEIRETLGLPSLAWMGKLWQVIPSPSELLTTSPSKLIERYTTKLRGQFPNHQLLNFLVGGYELLGDKFEESADSYLHSSKCDILVEKLVDRSIWSAFGGLVQHSINTGEPLSLEKRLCLRELIRERHTLNGKYVTDSFTSYIAWRLLVRSSMPEEAMELSKQEMILSDPKTQAEWQSRIDLVTEMERQIGLAINGVLLPKPQ